MSDRSTRRQECPTASEASSWGRPSPWTLAVNMAVSARARIDSGRVVGVGVGQAHAGAERDGADGQLRGVLDGADQALRELLEVAVVLGPRHHHELVAPVAGDEVGPPYGLPEPVAEHAQQLVADLLAERGR